MVKAGQYRRLIALAFLLAAALASLGFRLVELQVNRHDELRVLAERNTRRAEVRQPMRGQIKDVRGNPLAISVPAKTVCADPTLLGTHQPEVARVLAPLLQMREAELIERLQPRTREVNGKVITNAYVVLKRKVPLDTWADIENTMASLPLAVDEAKLRPSQKLFYRNLRRKSIFAEEDQVRVYPNQSLAAHVIGHVGGDNQAGQNGIELAFNSKLAGVQGWRRTELARGRELVRFRDQDVDARNGFNVVLTIDAGVQHIVENELAEAFAKHQPLSISALVVRPRTGEILGMATLPNFNPNKPGDYPMEALRNRAITDISEPGSTFKIVVISAALNEGLVHLHEVFDCERGRFSYGGRILHDHGSHGLLSVENIITKSSNIGSAKIGLRLGEEKLYEYVRNFGFGSRTGIPLPGEVNGIVHPTKSWSKISIVQIPMGHGIATTPLQTVMAMCAIANGGKLMRPMLVSRLENEFGEVLAQYQPQVIRQVISEAAAQQTVQALKTVVAEQGTATKARLDNYTVAGKTGTAQKAGPGGYMPGKYFSSFIGFFPADNPEICVSIVMDEPRNGHFGGQTAAPVFKNVAERAARYLNIRPDIEPEPAVKESLTTASVTREQR